MFGWITRNRLFWASSQWESFDQLAGRIAPPTDITYTPAGKRAAVLRYTGSKPIPKSLPVEDGYRLKTDPHLVLQGAAPPLFTLTREYYHWLDKDCSASATAIKRWAEDGQRYPPGAYEEHNLFFPGRQLARGKHSRALCIPRAPSADDGAFGG